MRKAVLAIVVIVSIVLGAVAIELYLTKDNVTVSGQAGVVTLVPAKATIQSIEFADIQTGISTTYQFHSTQQYSSGIGNYTVTLQKGHGYKVYISFYVINPEKAETHFAKIFFVNATAGETEITKNFWYP